VHKATEGKEDKMNLLKALLMLTEMGIVSWSYHEKWGNYDFYTRILHSSLGIKKKQTVVRKKFLFLKWKRNILRFNLIITIDDVWECPEFLTDSYVEKSPFNIFRKYPVAKLYKAIFAYYQDLRFIEYALEEEKEKGNIINIFSQLQKKFHELKKPV